MGTGSLQPLLICFALYRTSFKDGNPGIDRIQEVPVRKMSPP